MTRRFPSAWSDPEHVRLAAFRSWWDEGGDAVYGPLPAGDDPWSGQGPQAAPRVKGGSR